jgi:hypothetical protein
MKKFTFICALMFFMIGAPIILAQEKQAISPIASASPNTSIKKHTALFKQTSLLDPIQQIILGYLDSWDPVDHESGIHTVTFSSDGSTKAVQYFNGTAIISKNDQALCTLPRTSKPARDFYQIALSPNGQYCARAFKGEHSISMTPSGWNFTPDSFKSYIEIWDTISGTLVKMIDFGSYFNYICLLQFSLDGSCLISLDESELLIINTKDWSHKSIEWPKIFNLNKVKPHGLVATVFFEMPYITLYINHSKDIGNYNDVQDGYVIKYDISSSQVISTKQYLKDVSPYLNIIALPIAKKVVLLGGLNMVYFDDINLLHDSTNVKPHSIDSTFYKPVIAFSNNEKYFASAQVNAIAIWDAQTKKIIQEIKLDQDFPATFRNYHAIDRQDAIKLVKNSSLLLAQEQSCIYSYRNLKLLLEEEIASDKSLISKK